MPSLSRETADTLARVDRTVAEVFACHARWPSVREIAGRLGMDVRTLRRTLALGGGGCARERLGYLRMQHAARQIALGVKIDAVRHAVGYAPGNKSGFNTQFRRHFGCAPSEYRSRCIDGDMPSKEPGHATVIRAVAPPPPAPA